MKKLISRIVKQGIWAYRAWLILTFVPLATLLFAVCLIDFVRRIGGAFADAFWRCNDSFSEYLALIAYRFTSAGYKEIYMATANE